MLIDNGQFENINRSTCKWKYKYLSLSSNSGWRVLTSDIASSMQPFCILSRILILSSSSFRSIDGCIPVSKRNFSADSLKPSGRKKWQQLTLYLLVSSADNLCEQFGLRSGPTNCYSKHLRVKLRIFSYPIILTCVLGVQKNYLIETVLLSTHNICFGWEIRKIILNNPLLSRDLHLMPNLAALKLLTMMNNNKWICK